MIAELADQGHTSVITIYHRHALEIVSGAKRMENRPKRGNFRGLALVHMGKRKLRDADYNCTFTDPVNRKAMRDALLEAPSRYGQIVGVVRIVDCLPREDVLSSTLFTSAEKEHATGPYVWIISEVCPIPPGISYTGGQGAFRRMPSDEFNRVIAQL